MTDIEAALQAELDKNPGDHTVRLVLADHLDEIDDPRAAGYRALGQLGKQVDHWMGDMRSYGYWESSHPSVGKSDIMRQVALPNEWWACSPERDRSNLDFPVLPWACFVEKQKMPQPWHGSISPRKNNEPYWSRFMSGLDDFVNHREEMWNWMIGKFAIPPEMLSMHTKTKTKIKTEEDVFQEQIDSNPYDFTNIAVFSDWLQDRDDPRWEGYAVIAKWGGGSPLL